MNIESIDTTNMCSHLKKKLFEEDGVYHHLWIAMRDTWYSKPTFLAFDS